jgi:hypothetical protein
MFLAGDFVPCANAKIVQEFEVEKYQICRMITITQDFPKYQSNQKPVLQSLGCTARLILAFEPG